MPLGQGCVTETPAHAAPSAAGTPPTDANANVNAKYSDSRIANAPTPEGWRRPLCPLPEPPLASTTVPTHLLSETPKVREGGGMRSSCVDPCPSTTRFDGSMDSAHFSHALNSTWSPWISTLWVVFGPSIGVLLAPGPYTTHQRILVPRREEALLVP